MTTIPDHVGREAVRLLNEEGVTTYRWPKDCDNQAVITAAKLLMNPPAPMADPDEEAAKRVLLAGAPSSTYLTNERIAAATEQMRLERQAWEAGDAR